MGTWNEELAIPLHDDDAQSSILQLDLLDATLQEEGLKACTFQLGDFVPWNGYHLDVRQAATDWNLGRVSVYLRTLWSTVLLLQHNKRGTVVPRLFRKYRK